MSITLQNISREFGDYTAIKDITFHVEDGEIVGLLGTSGSGKSTLLRAISGLDKEYEGSVLFNGKEKTGVEDSTSFIFQEPRLFPWLTVKDNISFGLKGKSDKEIQKIVRTILKEVNLEDIEDLYPAQLSGGMAQRVAIARALITDPEVLLLDEPFSAVDAFTKMQLQELLLKIWENIKPTMVLVTHDIDEALYLCDRIVVLSGQPGEVREIIEIKEDRSERAYSENIASLKERILGHLNLNLERNDSNETSIAASSK